MWLLYLRGEVTTFFMQTINITVPTGWHSLTQKQLRYLLFLISEAVTSLAWTDRFPQMPVRFERIGRHRALRADFQGVPFETFIVCENLYQGFLYTQNEELLSQMATHLYDSKRVRPDKV